MEQKAPEYRIAKVTFENRLCPSCSGKKTREVNIGNHQYKTVSCSTCNGKGFYSFENLTQVDFRQALNEMGIYRMIENTVNEIIEKKNVSSNS